MRYYVFCFEYRIVYWIFVYDSMGGWKRRIGRENRGEGKVKFRIFVFEKINKGEDVRCVFI